MSAQDAPRRAVSKNPASRLMSKLRDAKVDARKTTATKVEAANKERAQPVEGRWPLPGLAPMTRVETSFGKVHAVALRKGDEVRTKSGEYRKIVWLNRVLLDQSLLTEKPDANPVRIRAGSFGRAVPSHDILVSPRQKVRLDDRAGRAEAADLEGRSGIERQPETGLSYTMFHLGEPAEVVCDGVLMLFEPPHARPAD